MGKNNSQFVCQNCGAKYSKWAGHCSNCDAWNTIIEDLVVSEITGKNAIAQAKTSGKILKFTKINDISVNSNKERLKTEFAGLNEVLGGGILKGSVTLLAGQPGIGKFVLKLQKLIMFSMFLAKSLPVRSKCALLVSALIPIN